eukprot:8532439-Ditylum_brightwellii.AAC.1
MHNEFKHKSPGMIFGQLAKYTSHMYKNLITEEKTMWIMCATQDKACHNAQIPAYILLPGHDTHRNLLENHLPCKCNTGREDNVGHTCNT